MRYDKLVRDKIIDIIESSGEKAIWHIAHEKEYQEKLREKLKEEVGEFLKDDSLEEMADIFEVITAILAEKKMGYRTSCHCAERETRETRRVRKTNNLGRILTQV